MAIKIVKNSMSRKDLAETAKNQYGSLVKAVVDIKQGLLAIGGELHADEEAVLLEQGSQQENLWGINLYPEKLGEEWIEFDSVINLRPSQGNSSRGIENFEVRTKIIEIVGKLIMD